MQWNKPSNGFVRVHFDRSFNLKNKRASIGVFVRDKDGNVLGVHQDILEGVMGPIVSEAVTVTKAMSFALQMGFSKIILEGDGLGVIV